MKSTHKYNKLIFSKTVKKSFGIMSGNQKEDIVSEKGPTNISKLDMENLSRVKRSHDKETNINQQKTDQTGTLTSSQGDGHHRLCGRQVQLSETWYLSSSLARFALLP